MDLPEAGLVRKTYVVREMDFPPNVQLSRRGLLRWFALHFGLLTGKESRTTVLDVLDALFFLIFSQKTEPTTLDIQNYIKERNKKEISDKLVRYHLKRLMDINLLCRKKNKFYYFNNSPSAEKKDLKSAFNYWVSKEILKTLNTTESVLEKIQGKYQK